MPFGYWPLVRNQDKLMIRNDRLRTFPIASVHFNDCYACESAWKRHFLSGKGIELQVKEGTGTNMPLLLKNLN
jgi:hypothetical protein